MIVVLCANGRNTGIEIHKPLGIIRVAITAGGALISENPHPTATPQNQDADPEQQKKKKQKPDL